MRTRRAKGRKQDGAILIISMIFIVVFASLGLAMVSLSNSNVQVAKNHKQANRARHCAESGYEIVRYWINTVTLSGTLTPSQRLTQTASSLQSIWEDNGISNLTLSASGSTLSIPWVSLDGTSNNHFSALLTQVDPNTLRVRVTGERDSITRIIQVDYQFIERANTAFDYGVATKGPLLLSGNIELTGVTISIESNAFIESLNDPVALSITGNSQIGGDVKIAHPNPIFDFQGGQVGVGGVTGDEIYDHIETGVDVPDFPEPYTAPFASYAVNIVDENTDTSLDATFENIRILADTNPNFTGHSTLKGVVFIETPNVVTFTGAVDMTGIIVGDGDWTDNSGTNQLIFQGNVDSTSVSELPTEAQYEGLHEEIGTFVMAPGFSVSFGGSFSTLAGAIAGNGVSFFGNAGGTINGSIINYSDETMSLSGNSDLFFNRSGLDEVPAGFIPQIILQLSPTSYSEPTT
jgi:Tfp pilus assembly protein PilX